MRGRSPDGLAVDPQTWRDSLFTRLLRWTAVLGAVVYVPSVYAALQTDLFGLAAMDTLALGAVAGMARFTWLAFRWRAAIYCLVFYGLGVASLVFLGPIAQIYLFGCSIMAAVLLGLRAGVAAALLSSATLLAVGFFGHLAPPLSVPHADHKLVELFSLTANFSLVNTLLTLAIGGIIAGLDRALRYEVAARAALEQERMLLRSVEAERARLLGQLQLQIERMPIAYLLVDSDLRYSRWNPAAARMFGFAEAEIIGKHPFDVIVPPKSQPEIAGVFDKIRAGSMDEHGESENVTKSGRTIICEWHNTPLFEENGAFAGMLSLAQDITERKTLETQLRQSQKMEAVGLLAGGVAHDFNNILALILLQADFLKRAGGLSAEQSEYAEGIVTTVKRAATLTRQLLLFCSREAFQPAMINLSEAIRDMVNMLQRLVGDQIKIVVKEAPQPAMVNADQGMIDQVILNLVLNARDAMPAGGRLCIEISAVEFDQFTVPQSPEMRAGSFVCLSVSDNGTGISKENLPKIFQPFFTTKAVGKGSGLGLATVFGIVRQHQGWVNVYSELGCGTNFQIYLPRLAGQAEPRAETALAAVTHGGDETVLIAEDEPVLRASIKKALGRLGYRVLEAATGGHALEIWRGNRGEIRLLLTDLVMPDGMTGKELAQTIMRDTPDLPVIFMSGYSADVVGKDIPMQEGFNFMSKPFSTEELAKMVRNALDRSAMQVNSR